MELFYGYFEEFRENPTVVFSGDRDGLLMLAAFLGRHANEGSASLSERALPGTPMRGTRIALRAVAVSGGMHVERVQSDGVELGWSLAPDDSMEFAAMLRVLCAAAVAAHQYLDDAGGRGTVTVLASRGEYGPDLFDE